MSDDGEGGGAKSVIIFLLIFGVGNYILWQTTGILIIPIRK